MTTNATETSLALGENTVSPNRDLDGTSELVEGLSGPALVGTQCSQCLTIMAGAREVCSSCVGQDLQQLPLGPAGVLYSHTTIHVSPTSPEPFTLGYVDLEQGVRILALIHSEHESLRCDLPVTLGTNSDTWFFAPSDTTGSNAAIAG